MQIATNAATTIPAGVTESVASGLANAAQEPGGSDRSTPFADLFSNAVGQIDALENQARNTVDRMMTGSGVDVHQAMIATQKASMAFELALAVRNKAVQAYQSVMGMQF
jgi:flagellar hook-basal body complex protein FliE